MPAAAYAKGQMLSGEGESAVVFSTSPSYAFYGHMSILDCAQFCNYIIPDIKLSDQTFWLTLLSDVLGVEDVGNFITFEEQVKLDHTSFIDGIIPSTHVLIEQKSHHQSEARRTLIDLFKVLDTKPEDRDPYMDNDLAAFPETFCKGLFNQIHRKFTFKDKK